MGNKTTEERNMELMQTLDDAWNAQDLETFAKRHKRDVVVRWPGQGPTHGVDAHRLEAIQFFKTFPDQRLGNRPYKTFFASGDWTCSLASNHLGLPRAPAVYTTERLGVPKSCSSGGLHARWSGNKAGWFPTQVSPRPFPALIATRPALIRFPLLAPSPRRSNTIAGGTPDESSHAVVLGPGSRSPCPPRGGLRRCRALLLPHRTFAAPRRRHGLGQRDGGVGQRKSGEG